MAAEPATRNVDEALTVRQPAAPEHSRSSERARLAAAFRDLGAGEGDKAAFARTRNWYRSGGMARAGSRR